MACTRSPGYRSLKRLLAPAGTRVTWGAQDSILLGAYQAGSKTEADGRLYLRMTDGQVKLPDLCVNDKNDTFHLNNETFGTFRLMARAVQREGYGQLSTLDNVRPTVSGRFIVSAGLRCWRGPRAGSSNGKGTLAGRRCSHHVAAHLVTPCSV